MFTADSMLRRRGVAGAVAAALVLAGSGALAHTGVKSPAVEGEQADNALRIGHGCEGAGGERPLIAQSVVFPTEDPEISASDPNVTILDLGEVIEQGSLAGLLDLIQDRSIFLRQSEKVDANGNEIGFQGREGRLRVGLRGRVPFQFTAPNFVADSCAKRLRIEIAIADICSAQRPTLAPGKVNLWIPDNGSHYAVAGAAAGLEGIGDPAVLSVERDLVLNPLDASCNGGFDVTLTPSAAQLDADLPIARYWR